MRKRTLPLIIVGIGILGFILLRITRPEPEPATPTERSWRVETLTITPQQLQASLTLYGTLESPERFTVVAPLAGRIAALPARDGQPVNAGEPLLELDQADIQPRLLQAEADLADAEAQLQNEQLSHANDRRALELEKRLLENAESNLQRVTQLVERQLAPRSELDNARDARDRAQLTLSNRQRSLDTHNARLTSLQARRDRASAALEAMRRDAERSRLLAPFDGMVANLRAAVGDQVNANAALLDFYPLQGMELRALLPQQFSQDFIRALADGEQLDAFTLGTAKPLRLVLERIAGQADARGVEALFRVVEPSTELRLGSLLAISVERPTHGPSVALPYSALYGNDSIYQLRDGRMQRLQVERIGEQLGENGERLILVRSAQLQSGMQIITTHLPNAVQGLRVDTAGESAE